MARKGKTAVLKRQREVRKAEKAALKRDQREQRAQNRSPDTPVATQDDLEGYGVATDSDDESSEPPRDASKDASPHPPTQPNSILFSKPGCRAAAISASPEV
ncbi:MAG: hypothetical protein V3T33_03440 [Myxococcota bacterium]